jgi:AraC-like DNA-binding protein
MTLFKLRRWLHPLCVATINAVYVPVPIETVSLDILHRSGWRPVTRATVTAWFQDRSRHVGACPCWRCSAAAKADPDRVWRCLRGWRRTAAAEETVARCPAPMADFDAGRPLPEQARALRESGLTMQAIAEQLHCAPSTVHRHLHA